MPVFSLFAILGVAHCACGCEISAVPA